MFQNISHTLLSWYRCAAVTLHECQVTSIEVKINEGLMRTFHLQVKMWVQLLIPRIEDGNNFGVSIQEETVAELRTVEGEAASYLDQISRYEA